MVLSVDISRLRYKCGLNFFRSLGERFLLTTNNWPLFAGGLWHPSNPLWTGDFGRDDTA